MSITRDELLADPLMPLINEEPKPAPTLSELFNTERVILGAITDRIGDAIRSNNPTEHSTSKEYVDNQQSGGHPVYNGISKTPIAPEFDFDDPLKNMLARNAWNQMECRMAGGGYHIDKEATFKNIGFMLKLNMAIYDNLPHENFIGVQPMDNPCQMIHHNEWNMTEAGVEELGITKVNNSIKSYAIEAKSKRLTTCIPNETIQDMTSTYQLDIEDEILEMTAHQISGELYSEMVGKIEQNASVSTVVAEKATPPTSLDIMASIHNAMDEIDTISGMNRRANWVIMSPQMAAILLSDKHAIDISTRTEAPHISSVGRMHGMNIFMDTEGAIKPNSILVGRKGEHTFNQGIAYCPHTLAMDSGSVVNPTTFESVKSFVSRGDYFTPDDSSQYFHKIEFKEAPEEHLVGYKAGQQEMDVGYFYCPYIPLMTTKTVPEEDLMDIVLPFGAPERKTIAELFS